MDGKLMAFAPAGLTTYTIPDGVTTIGSYAFQLCSSLTSITIPDGVTTIGNGAFSSCRSLTSITLSESLTTIGEMAFYGCERLTSITIPDGVTTIGIRAFYSCSSLTNVYSKPTTPPTFGASVFSNSPVAAIHVPQASVDAYKAASGWSDYASKIAGYDF
mgnify:FL=1